MCRQGVATGALLGLILLVTGLGSAEEATHAVFQLIVVTHEGPLTPQGSWKGTARGTAFFISQDGKAITNSHVVYRARRDPARYPLLAIVDKDLYSARLICASELPYDPLDHPSNVPFSRDVAEVQIVPLSLPWLNSWGYTESGAFHPVATAHRGGTPLFPALTVADTARAGDRVEITGFGFQSILRHPQMWTADGVVTRTASIKDGTETFEIDSTLRAQRGHSGSPVLNAKGHVIGLWTWYSHAHANLSTAQGNAVVVSPCASPLGSRRPPLASSSGSRGGE